MMDFEQLLQNVRDYTGVYEDSRQVQPGGIFVTGPGIRTDGRQYIADAVARGAALIVRPPGEAACDEVPCVEVDDYRRALSVLSDAFYASPSREMTVVGVTGTCGKTTTTYLTESILRAAGRRVGVVGSVNYRYGDVSVDSMYTTPRASDLYRLLRAMCDAGHRTVVMEVSSHAIALERTSSLCVDLAIFTNLSPEHLDLHTDMEQYFQAKSRLFVDYLGRSREAGKQPVAAVHSTEYGERLVGLMRQHHGSRVPIVQYALDPAGARVDFDGSALEISADEISGRIDDVPIRSRLVGSFNAENVLAAVAGAKALGIERAAIAEGIRTALTVPGRLERVDNAAGIRVFVDFAHKVDALQRVAQTLASLKGSGRLLVVFGCGSERDRTKRPKMGAVAHAWADHVWITSDNPRREDPARIIDDILSGLPSTSKVNVEPDRSRAIQAALRAANPGDTVLIAGRGGEKTQILRDPANPDATLEIAFDDCVVAARCLGERRPDPPASQPG